MDVNALVEELRGLSREGWYSVFHNLDGARLVYLYDGEHDRVFLGGDGTDWLDFDEVDIWRPEELLWISACGQVVRELRRRRRERA